MIKLLGLIFTFIMAFLRLLRAGSVLGIVAENIALRKQLISVSRHHKRAPNLITIDRMIFGFLTSMINPKRLFRIGIILKPATLLKYHKALVKRKYHLLYSAKSQKKPGPKGPDQAVIDVIVEMKQRNPRYGYRRIAMQISNTFGMTIDKDVVRRVLQKHFKETPGNDGPSWLTFIGHMKDSLWSIDLFRAESIHLKSHWIMLIMDQFTRRIIGFAVHKGDVTGISLCCMFVTTRPLSLANAHNLLLK